MIELVSHLWVINKQDFIRRPLELMTKATAADLPGLIFLRLCVNLAVLCKKYVRGKDLRRRLRAWTDNALDSDDGDDGTKE